MKKNTNSLEKKPTIQTLELETYLANVQEKADKISDRFVIMFFILGICLAPIYDTWSFTLLSVFTVGLYAMARFALNNKFYARMVISLVYGVFVLQFIGQMHGMAEMHFFFFINIALLIIYQDWKIMIPYVVVTVAHHTVLAYIQVVYDMPELANYFITYGGMNLSGTTTDVTGFQLFFHFSLLVLMAFVAGWWAVIFRNNSIQLKEKESEAKQQAEELKKTRASLELQQELQSSEEELRQNSEELQSTNDQMVIVQREIEEKQNLLNKAEKLVGMASYEVDLTTQKLTHSDNLTLIYGEDRLDNTQKIIEIAHPEDTHRVVDTLTQAAEGKIQNYDISYRSKGQKLEEYRYYRAKGEVVKDERDNPEKLVGTVQDITAQVIQDRRVEEAYQKVQASEEELRQNSEELQSTNEQMLVIQREQEKFVSVIKYLDAFVAITDMQGKVQFLNETGQEMSGFGEDYKGKLISEFHNEEGAKKAHELIIPTVMQKGEWRGEHQLQNHETKEVFETLANVFVVKDPNTQQPIALATVQMDITAQKKLEKVIKKQNAGLQISEKAIRKNYEKLQATQENLVATQIEQEKFVSIIRHVDAFIAITDMKGQTQFLNEKGKQMSGFGENYKGKLISEFHTEKSAKKAQEVIIPTVMQKGEWKGEHQLQNHETKEIFKTLANVFVVKDPHTQQPIALATVQMDITEQKRVEKSIQEQNNRLQSSEEELRQNSEELQSTNEQMLVIQREIEEKELNLRALIDNTDDSIFSMDKNYCFVTANEKVISQYAAGGVKIEKGMSVIDLAPTEEVKQQFKELYDRALIKGENVKVEQDYSDEKVGIVAFFELLINPIIDNQKQVIGCSVFARDITSRKKQELQIQEQNKKLQTSEEEVKQNYEQLQMTQEDLTLQTQRLEQIFDGVPAMIYQFKMTKDGQVSFPVVSKGSEIVYGLSPEVVMNDATSIIASIHDDDKLTFQESLEESAQNMTDWKADLRTIIDGKQHWIRGNSKPIKDKEGNIIWSGIVQEVTAQKQLELDIQAKNNALQASEEEIQQNYEILQTTQEVVNNAFSELDAQFSAISTTLGYVEISTDRKIERVNDLFSDWLSYTIEELQGKSHIDLVPNTLEDKEKYNQLWKILEAGETYTDVFKRKNKEGEDVWLYGAYCPVKNKDGVVVKIIKVASNYSVQKEAEKELQRLSLVASKTNNAVIITDKNGIIEWVNEGFTKISEYSSEEAIGQKPSTLLQREGTDIHHIEAIRKGLGSQKPFRQEIYNYSKTGRGYWLDLNITPIFDDNNELVNFVAIESDITERKQIEAKVQSTNYRLQNLIENVGDLVFLLDAKEFVFKQYYASSEQDLVMKPEFFLNKKITEVGFPEAPLQLIITALQKANQDKEKATAEYKLELPHGDEWFSLIASPILNEEKEVEDILCVTRNITYIKQTEIAVQERNIELARQKEEVEKSFVELQVAQNQLIQSEKMASLGQLVANIAHEINTPLGAIRSSAISIEDILQETLPTLPSFLKTLDDSILYSFTEFVQQSSQKSDILSSREKRTIKYDLIDQFEDLNIDEADEYADWIVDMNMYKESELYLPLLKPDNSKEIFYTAYQLSTIVRSNRTVKTATDRAAKIVFALKNFARQDQTGEKSIVNINQSIEVTLTLYHNQIKHGVDITRDLGEIPDFMGYPDELVQVWTNIIHNALQAMKNKGRLFIQTSIENNKVLVSIQDNGGGIPKAVQDKIFDAFFTTKGVGEGSGLGLDITKKIIEKHNGKIWFDSLEGKGTTFFIELPLK